jgi:hypothetical protein|tara:strand:- start:418 stop:1008 length:591 start_codon:yes stop_codon:yes gene_type:complete
MENILYGDIVGLQVIRPPGVMTNGRVTGGPATEEFMNNLEEVNVSDQMIIEKQECSICLEVFKEGDKCISLPCDSNHSFHSCGDGCSGIKEWLTRDNTCPLCRTEFPCSEVSTMDSEPEPENTDTESHILLTNMMQSLIQPHIDNNGDDENFPSEEHLVNTIQNYITTLAGIVHDSEETDLQRAIEASLVEHVESE